MIRRAHLYWARVPPEKKRRPVIVLSVDRRNELAHDIVVAPCSTTLKPGPWHVRLPSGTARLAHPSVVKCEQVTTLLKEWIDPHPIGGPVPRQVLLEVRAAILAALDFDERMA